MHWVRVAAESEQTRWVTRVWGVHGDVGWCSTLPGPVGRVLAGTNAVCTALCCGRWNGAGRT